VALRERRDECIVRMPRLRDNGGLRWRVSSEACGGLVEGGVLDVELGKDYWIL
jgi:hypothetical protein